MIPRMTLVDRKDIADLYADVFDQDLDAEVAARPDKENLSFYLFESAPGRRTGFAVLQWRREDCHIWLLGLRRENRGQGLGHELFRLIEWEAQQRRCRRITLSTYNHHRAMLALSVKHGFKLVETESGRYGDGIKIRLEKELGKRELRILLTNRCNFNCIFCHSEGMDNQKRFGGCDAARIVEYVGEAMKIGFGDITFSGGEPLLHKAELITIIRELSSWDKPPDLTVVTNAMLLDDSFVETVKAYPGRFKVNVSLHALAEDTFREIVGTPCASLEQVRSNIMRLTRAGIATKVNCVILAGLNDSEDQIRNYCLEAARMGVSAVKFLELLVTLKNEALYRAFRSADSIVHTISPFVRENRAIVNPRCRYFIPLDKDMRGLVIEVSQCTCKLGCANCPQVRDRTIGPDLNHYPCFIQSEKPIAIAEATDIGMVFRRGEAVLRKYADIYGEDSPILLKQKEYVAQRRDAYFAVSEGEVDLDAVLRRLRFTLRKKGAYTRRYCHPANPGQEWKSGRKSLKIGSDGHTPDSMKFFYSENSVQMVDGYPVQCQEFLSDQAPPSVYGRRQAEKIMEALDFVVGDVVEFHIAEYRCGHTVVSAARCPAGCILRVPQSSLSDSALRQLLEQSAAEPIREPLDAWLQRRLESAPP